ncbi:dipeptidase [Massilia sp. TS11]|uniref:dipeptidase n=1 Tax=Massilia sp. TS11 TaxID=2908003 RepID=UPI001ED9CA0D|nr:dipeptidase [Massilia sp. TS11]MCG2585619.1 dipeptidase [Massilia sp. TS11]
MRSVLLPLLFAACSAHAADDAALRHARALLKATPLVDGHNDLPELIQNYKPAPSDLDAYDLRKPTVNETDIARLRAGQLGAQFWSVYVPGELKSGWARMQLEQIELTRRLIARYPDVFVPATRADDIGRAFKAGKIASFMGIEGGHVIENSLGALRAYYDLGVRYMTLTHNVTLDWADAALDTPRHHGLTPFGKEVVREMNRLGMLVDLSHVSPEVMRDALDTSEAPVIFSHSSARALTEHPRNVPDEILKRMQANGGVVMVTFVPNFVNQAGARWGMGLMARQKGVSDEAELERIAKAYEQEVGPRPPATLQQVADHIDYVARVAGYDHVGIGADYCGLPVSQGLEDVSTYPALFAELIRRGWSDANLKKLASQNLVRAMRQAEQVAARLQKTRAPSTATIEKLDRKA